MSDQRLKIAVFIDFDNVEIGVKTTLGLQFDVGAVLEAIKERGEIITKVAYGDWKRAGDHGRAMAQHAVRLVQRVMTPGGDKNGADINLALDALEMAFTHDHINAFVIVGGDSDFITLVEKLKQYDKKVFVVGGRAFTSQVMQKNCTEFIAYENVARDGSDARAQAARRAAGFRQPSAAARQRRASLDQALPLVKRALKVLADREVSPQLGLLKSTLLQLDSSFSERDYGASTFRDFAEKLEQRGLVTLKHSGRTTLVELSEQAARRKRWHPPPVACRDRPQTARELRPGVTCRNRCRVAWQDAPPPNCRWPTASRWCAQVLAEATTPPRWPMYLRQMKQFIRTARPDFDERRYGSLPDLLRACQKDGLLRLERDRQGGLRAFAGSSRGSSVPHGWGTLASPQPDVEFDEQQPTLAGASRSPRRPNRPQCRSSRQRSGRLRWRRLPTPTASSPRTISWRCSASWPPAIRTRGGARHAQAAQARRRTEKGSGELSRSRPAPGRHRLLVHGLDVTRPSTPLDPARRQHVRPPGSMKVDQDLGVIALDRVDDLLRDRDRLGEVIRFDLHGHHVVRGELLRHRPSRPRIVSLTNWQRRFAVAFGTTGSLLAMS